MTYYINSETHEVHKDGCEHMPTTNKTYLGVYTSPSFAVLAAKTKGYSNADGCYYCCNSAHTK